MKKIFTLVLITCLTLNVFAETTPQEKHIIQLFTSGELVDLKMGSQQAYHSQIKNTEVIDIAAEILLRTHKDILPNQIDTLSWLTKAVGATRNDRYVSVLEEVEEDNRSSKIRSYARKALRRIKSKDNPRYTQGMVALPRGVYPFKTQADQNKELITMITSGSLSSFKNAMKKIVNANNQSQEVGDATAEVLLALYSRNFEYESDSLAWAAKALGVNNSGRYHKTLSEVLNNTSDLSIKKHTKKALKKHGEAKGQQYEKGMSSHKSNFI